MPELTEEPKGIVRKTFFVSEVKDLGEGELEAIVASESVDRANEILEMDGLDIKTYINTNPVVMWVHDYKQPPIAQALSLKKQVDGTLFSKMKFAIAEYDFARLIYNLYKGLYMRAFSIGFLPKELDDSKEGILRWTKAEMIEFSAVPIGMNKEALLTAKAKGLDVDMLERIQKGELDILGKSVIPYKKEPLADKGQSWSFRAADYDITQLKRACTWFDSENPEAKGSYKLPHHTPDGKTVWRGCTAARAALAGARGGVNIPDSDIAGCENHIKKHYADFDEKWEKDITQDLVDIQIAEIDQSIENLKEIKASMEHLKKGSSVSLKIDVTGVKSNFELVKKITSALDKELSTDTDAGDPLPANKKLVRIKKVAQLGDRAYELLITSINEKLKEKTWLKLKS